MKKQMFLIAIAGLLLLPMAAFAQLPATTYGWNLGNTLEPNSGPGTWNNPLPTQQLINAVKAAGFNTIRIPCAWGSNANASNTINPTYMALVKQTVDWSRAAGLTVIINNHWDGGWFDSNGFRRYNSKINTKLQTLWTQVANTFKNYDSGLLFACTNEPAADTQAETTVMLQYYQNWINKVRATGGNNATRWLIIQGPNTNIDHSYNFFSPLPTDPTPGRLAVEVHYYDPFNFCFMNQDENWGNMAYFWGQAYHTSVPNMLIRNSTWGEEAYMLAQFQKMQAKYTSQGVPVLLGEFGAIKRSAYPDLTGTEQQRHFASRTFYNKTIVDYCKQTGLKPTYWDNGSNANEGWAVFDRNTGAIVDSGLKSALTGGAALPPP